MFRKSMIRTDCFHVGRQDVDVDGKRARLYSFSIQDDKRCRHPETKGGGLFIEVEHATADDLRYIQRMVTALVEECLSKEVNNV